MDYIDNLLHRLQDDSLREGLVLPKEQKYNSTLTVSYAAREEAYSLEDPALLIPLKEKLAGSQKTADKITLLPMLIRLADKLHDHSIADHVLQFLKKEKVRWVKDVALRELVWSDLNILSEQDYLFTLALDKNWQINGKAFSLLHRLDNTYARKIEDLCLTLLKAGSSKLHEPICDLLARHGSLKSVPFVKDIIENNSNTDTMNSAIRALFHISGKRELSYFIALFETSRNSQVKAMLTQALCFHGDESIIPLLVKRAKVISAKPKKRSVNYVGESKPELVHIMEFLIKLPGYDMSLFEFIQSKKIQNLDKTERQWFDEHYVNDEQPSSSSLTLSKHKQLPHRFHQN